MTIPLIIIGFVSILGQVVILRELGVAFYGVELVYLIGIGVWLSGTGCGAILGRRRFAPSPAVIAWLFLAFALLLPADVAFVRGMRHLGGGVPGGYLSVWTQGIGVLLSLLPMGLLLGLMFQWAAKQYVSEQRSLAAAYAVESAGAVLGGAASTLSLQLGLQNFSTGIGCSLVAAATASVMMIAGARRASSGPRVRARMARIAVAAGTCIFVVVLLMSSSRLDREMTRWNHPYVVASRDTPYSRVTVTSRSGQITVYENDALGWETESTAAEELAHLAALQHPGARSVLILGGGVEGVVREVLKQSPESVDCAELDRDLFRMMLSLLPPEARDLLTQAPTRIVFGDPRRILARGGRYDLILVGMPDPASAQSNRFYTREFFQLARSHLHAGGVLAFRLRSAENFWPAALMERNASIVTAAHAAFDDVVVLPGTTSIVLAGTDPLMRDGDVLAERCRSRKIAARLVTPEYVRYLYTNDRFFAIAEELKSHGAQVNTDARPVCYYYATSVWLSRFFPQLLGKGAARTELLLPLQAGLVLLLAAVVVAAALAGRRVRLRLILLTGAAGFCGMLLETVLIVQYQVKQGILFQDIGLLLTLFMAGAALGAFVFDRLAARAAPFRLTGRGAAALMALTGLFVAWQVASGEGASLIAIGLSLVLTGSLVGAMFAYAGFASGPDQRRAVAPLYAADLAGGAVAAVLGSLLWLPLAGLKVAALYAALLALAAILLV